MVNVMNRRCVVIENVTSSAQEQIGFVVGVTYLVFHQMLKWIYKMEKTLTMSELKIGDHVQIGIDV